MISYIYFHFFNNISNKFLLFIIFKLQNYIFTNYKITFITNLINYDYTSFLFFYKFLFVFIIMRIVFFYLLNSLYKNFYKLCILYVFFTNIV